MRIVASLAALALAALLFGCGGSGETTGATTNSKPASGVSPAREIRSRWERAAACKRPSGASRWGCSVGSFRCQAVVTDRGWSVDCAKPGSSIAFTVRRG